MELREALNNFGMTLDELKGHNEKSLKRIYRQKAVKLHPDNKETGSEKAFVACRVAYIVLKDALQNGIDTEIINEKIDTSNKYSKVYNISFEDLLNSFKSRDIAKFNNGVWIIKFKIHLKLNGTQFTVNCSTNKNARDEYRLALYIPYNSGDKLDININGEEKTIILKDIGNNTLFNFQYLAKVTVCVINDSEE